MVTLTEQQIENLEQAAFESWLASERPSGDVECVERAWCESGARAEWLDTLAELESPNAAMLAADDRPAYDVKAMAGNGCIFPPPRVERCNLLVIAPISATGFSVWGA